jgi:hypothetical protein
MAAKKNDPKLTALRTNQVHTSIRAAGGRQKGQTGPITKPNPKNGLAKTEAQWAACIDRFFVELAKSARVVKSCELAGISYSEVYRRRTIDEEFKKRYEDAYEQGVQRLEDEAVRRAMTGVDEPVFYKGEEVAKITRYSDTLLMFLLKGNKPDKFKERVENTNLNLDLASRLEAAKKRGESK